MSLQFKILPALAAVSPNGTTFNPLSFDVSSLNNTLVYDVGTYSTVCVQAVFSPLSGAVLAVERSLDGANYFALEIAQSLKVATPLSDTIDSSAIRFIRVRPTTIDATYSPAITVLGKASQ